MYNETSGWSVCTFVQLQHRTGQQYVLSEDHLTKLLMRVSHLVHHTPYFRNCVAQYKYFLIKYIGIKKI